LSVDELDLERGRLDFAQLSGLVAAFEISPPCVVVETEEGREIRITARRDLSTGWYVSEYERRSSKTSSRSDGNSSALNGQIGCRA